MACFKVLTFGCVNQDMVWGPCGGRWWFEIEDKSASVSKDYCSAG